MVVALLLTFTMKRIEVKFLVALRHEGGTGNLRCSGVHLATLNHCLKIFHVVLFELHGKLLIFLNSALSLNHVLLGLVDEESAAEDSADNGKERGCDHDNNPRSGPIISSLNLNDSWVKISAILNDLLDGDVLVNGLLFENGLDVWSEDGLVSFDSVDVFNVVDDSVGGSCGDNDWVVTFSRYCTT